VKSGRKPLPREHKQAAGTLQACRDINTTIRVESSQPVAPAYLDPAALAVWQEELPRVMRAGTCELDSTLFARYCAVEAQTRAAYLRGEPIKAATSSELRRYAELLGIAGAMSRVVRGVAPASNDKPANAFAALPEA
jgi:phage terminase small subunit